MRNPDKVRENRLRRMAERQGLRLMKSRARDPRSLTYDGYILFDGASDATVFGGNYEAGLDAIEAFLLNTPVKRRA